MTLRTFLATLAALAALVVFLAAFRPGDPRERLQSPALRAFVEAGDSAPRDVFVGVVMRPGDCPSAIDALAALNPRAGAASLPVVGLVAGRGLDEGVTGRIARGAGIRFPLTRAGERKAAPVLRALGHHATPLIVVFDARGRVRAAAPVDGPYYRREVHRMRGYAEALRRNESAASGTEPELIP